MTGGVHLTFNQNHMQEVGTILEELSGLTKGEDVIIAILDTGIDLRNPGFKNSVFWNNSREIQNGLDDDNNGYIDDIYGWDFTNNDNHPNDESINSHGTHISGIIRSVAPNSKIMVLKIFDETKSTDFDIVAKAIRYAADNGADIVSMSFGSFTNNVDMIDAINYAIIKNVILLAASGNEGKRSVNFPARQYGVIGVGSVNTNLELSSFSNFGEEIDVVAPGEEINSTVRVNMGLRSTMGQNNSLIESYPMDFSNTSVNQAYQLIDGGFGTITELSGLEINNSLVLIERGQISFEEMVRNIILLNGSGLVVSNNSPDIFVGSLEVPSSISAVTVSGEVGKQLRNQMQLGLTTLELEISPSNYSLASGTSMATPHVSGFIALIKSFYKTLNIEKSSEDVVNLLMNSLTDLGPTGKDNFYGNGLLNKDLLSEILLDTEEPYVSLEVIDIKKELNSERLDIKITSSDNVGLDKILISINGNQEIFYIQNKSKFADFNIGVDLTNNQDNATVSIEAFDLAGNSVTETLVYQKGVGVITDKTESFTSKSLSMGINGIIVLIVFCRKKQKSAYFTPKPKLSY